MTPSWKSIAIGMLVFIIAILAYDGSRISQLEAQIAADHARLTTDCNAMRRSIAAPTPPVRQQSVAPNLPDRAAITHDASGIQAALRAREALWERTFHRQAQCESPPDNATFIECGNTYATAHKAFMDTHPLTGFMPDATR